MLKIGSPMGEIDTVQKEDLKSPSGARIVLVVCSCYTHEVLSFFAASKKQAAILLGISGDELEAAAICAMFTKQAQIVGCYASLDIAETKLVQLQKVTPFIARACHNFIRVE